MCDGNGEGGPDQGQEVVDGRTGSSRGWIPGSFGGDRENGGQHRRREHPLTALMLLTLACGKATPWPRDGDGEPEDPAVVSGRRRGLLELTALPLILLACERGPRINDEDRDEEKRRGHRHLRFSSVARSAGAQILRSGDVAAWFRWVFLDLDRHDADCRWAAALRRAGVG